MQKPVLGILGGVGPLATAYFMELIIQKTPVECDQDNIPMIVFNDPRFRTARPSSSTATNPTRSPR